MAKARKKPEAALPPTPTDQKQYRVIKKLRGEINHRPFDCKVDELIMLNPFEADILKAYIKEE